MKNLIYDSIKISGIGRPEIKTEFDLLPTNLPQNPTDVDIKKVEENKLFNESLKNNIFFTSLSVLSGRKLSVSFSFSENGEIFKDRLQLSLPVLNGGDMKNYILLEINNKLI